MHTGVNLAQTKPCCKNNTCIKNIPTTVNLLLLYHNDFKFNVIDRLKYFVNEWND